MVFCPHLNSQSFRTEANVVKMTEIQQKRKPNSNSLDVLEWMLAIDFDSVEVRRVRKGLFQKYVQVLNKSAFAVKRGD